MEEITSIRKLVELIFDMQFKNTEEKTATDLPIPTGLQTNDFPQKLQIVLCLKQIVYHPEWENYLKICCNPMFSSYDLYLRGVIFACLTESLYHEDAYEMFLSMCAVLRFFNERIFNSTDVDFRALYTDIVMVLYDNVLKGDFREKGGYKQLVEYIHSHRYLSWKCKDLVSTDAAAARGMILKDNEVKREFHTRVGAGSSRTDAELKTVEMRSIILTRKILSNASVKLPPKPKYPNLIEGLKSSQNEEKAEKSEKERIVKAAKGFVDSDASSKRSSNSESIDSETNLAAAFVDLDVTRQRCSSSDSDSKADHAIDHNGIFPPLGKMIEAVLRHYHARFSSPANPDNPIQKKPGENMSFF